MLFLLLFGILRATVHITRTRRKRRLAFEL
nr:MAG TPA: hypothetical protein [Bacteriophage sp.]